MWAQPVCRQSGERRLEGSIAVRGWPVNEYAAGPGAGRTGSRLSGPVVFPKLLMHISSALQHSRPSRQSSFNDVATLFAAVQNVRD